MDSLPPRSTRAELAAARVPGLYPRRQRGVEARQLRGPAGVLEVLAQRAVGHWERILHRQGARLLQLDARGPRTPAHRDRGDDERPGDGRAGPRQPGAGREREREGAHTQTPSAVRAVKSPGCRLRPSARLLPALAPPPVRRHSVLLASAQGMQQQPARARRAARSAARWRRPTRSIFAPSGRHRRPARGWSHPCSRLPTPKIAHFDEVASASVRGTPFLFFIRPRTHQVNPANMPFAMLSAKGFHKLSPDHTQCKNANHIGLNTAEWVPGTLVPPPRARPLPAPPPCRLPRQRPASGAACGAAVCAARPADARLCAAARMRATRRWRARACSASAARSTPSPAGRRHSWPTSRSRLGRTRTTRAQATTAPTAKPDLWAVAEGALVAAGHGRGEALSSPM